MIIDALIDPDEVVVEQVDTTSTRYDPDTREPIGLVRRVTSVTLSAQVVFGSTRRTAFRGGGQGGAHNEATGRIVLLRREVDALGVTLRRGDKITSIAGVALSPPVFLLAERRAGHLSNVANLLIWDFVDKAPAA